MEQQALKIERAYDGNRFIGWRLTTSHSELAGNACTIPKTLLVWSDPNNLAGFRQGHGFVPDVGKKFDYVECDITELAGA